MRLLHLFSFLLLAISAPAQRDTFAAYWHDRFLVDVGFDVAVPTGLFADNQNTLGVGGHLDVYANLGNRPIYLGLGYHHVQYSTESERFDELIDGELIPFSIRTNNVAHAAQLSVRVQPPITLPFFPYAEGLFRAQRFYSRTVIRDEDLDEQTDSNLETADGSFAYGAAAGAFVPLGNDEVALFLRVSYLRGTGTDYLVRRDEVINPVDPIDYFESVTSPTDRWLFSVGITGRIF